MFKNVKNVAIEYALEYFRVKDKLITNLQDKSIYIF